MNAKSPVVWAGAVGIAAIGGVALAVITQNPSSKIDPASSTSPTDTTQTQTEGSPRQATKPSESLMEAKPSGTVRPSTVRPSTVRPSTVRPADSSRPANSAAENSLGDGTPVGNKVEVCVVRMAIVSDANPPLNVRSTPSTTGDNIVGKLNNGTMVFVTQEQNNWLRITDPAQGWISKKQTENGCNQKVERVRFETGDTSKTLSDRFIGTGNHKYLLTAQKGQTMTVTAQDGPFPFLADPSGKLLLDKFNPDAQKTWTGVLPATGEYSLQMDSQYKGYTYSFLVEIK